MMSGKELFSCHNADILTCDTEKLADLKQVRIPTDLPANDRMTNYLAQVRNPYLLRVGNLAVKVSFSGERELASVLADLMSS